MSPPVRTKKHLGQHFLTDMAIAERIAQSLTATDTRDVLEVGPGTGALTRHLLQRTDINLYAIEVDAEATSYLRQQFPELAPRLVHGSFLRVDLPQLLHGKFCLIGNFPYNISSQIFFKVLEHKNSVPEVVCMLQREVAVRLAEKPGSRAYGILSVLLQAYYNIEYLFTVDEHVFAPPPKVKSAVVRLTRNSVQSLCCNEALFRQVVKTTFNQRRKALRNSLKPLLGEATASHPLLAMRPEQLGVAEFVELTNVVEKVRSGGSG
ncbi:MAG: 16S rRNA (adenine(1518)-N(6)/adenine(1519)-N(6))-dimethyltransferase RsmA [Prevotellaceae bacterium]|jgi:16S rRNA (adenine1518-N6/adenine1519-N6)-dimethyltransferase|nr:16S rRNA (adenine(1518)-N(6)/adenine(1519)-N(6))-dimethyltransferase RsmA [Prevotellaceae bacterium]